ncbi:hypothetical protein KBI33_00030 [Candidatus Shapirobacteria bacterium]|nr:hypothetical protein [Candidatus Shapirobacteria bacterium]
MRKEVILAIAGGVILGLLVMGGLWWTSRTTSEKNLAVPSSAPIENQSPTLALLTPVLSLPLKIESPEDESISGEEKVVLKGETAPGSVVVVIYPEGENIVEADGEGKFETEILLVGGVNEIKVTAYDKDGSKAEANLTLIYSTAKI